MSSEDIRYARRSAVGAAAASVEVIGLLAGVEWIQLTGDPRTKQVLVSAALTPRFTLHGIARHYYRRWPLKSFRSCQKQLSTQRIAPRETSEGRVAAARHGADAGRNHALHDQINRNDLDLGPGGIDSFIEAAKALCDEPYAAHKGYVFSNAWVYQTVEAMSIALMVDARGDRETLSAQAKMRATQSTRRRQTAT